MTAKEKEPMVNWPILRRRLLDLTKALKWPAVVLLATFILAAAIARETTVHVDYRLILDYVSVLRWPVVALITLLVFKPHLPGLIARVRELGLGNSKLKFDPAEPQTPTSAADLKQADEEADEAVTPSADDGEADSDLHALLTSPQAIAAYEQVYRQIFGTQLEVLKRLLSYIDGLGVRELQDIFEQHTQRTKGLNSYPNLISFMQFLLDNVLVLYDPEAKVYKLTNAGHFFLKYLNEQGLLDRYKAF